MAALFSKWNNIQFKKLSELIKKNYYVICEFVEPLERNILNMRLECSSPTPAQCLSCPLVETSNYAKNCVLCYIL